MQHFILSVMGLSIPILALLIPLVVVTSHFLVKPVADLLAGRVQPPDAPAGALAADGRIPELERQVAELQSTLQRVLEEQDFERQLRIGPPHA